MVSSMPSFAGIDVVTLMPRRCPFKVETSIPGTMRMSRVFSLRAPLTVLWSVIANPSNPRFLE